jgi:heme-degrading monooxygenase HmoA
MWAVLWRYRVHSHARAEFEACYGPAGAWAALFARAPGYLGTELMRGEGAVYLTIDRWHAATDFEAFLLAHRDDYDALDRRTEPWAEHEERLGAFGSVPLPRADEQ